MHTASPVLDKPAKDLASAVQIGACFQIPSDTFELIYGAECVQALAALCDYREDSVGLDWGDSFLWPDWLAEVEVMFTGWHSRRLDAELLARMPRLSAPTWAPRVRR